MGSGRCFLAQMCHPSRHSGPWGFCLYSCLCQDILTLVDQHIIPTHRMMTGAHLDQRHCMCVSGMATTVCPVPHIHIRLTCQVTKPLFSVTKTKTLTLSHPVTCKGLFYLNRDNKCRTPH